MSQDTKYSVTVVSPVYDDAEAAARLLEELGAMFVGSDVELRMLLVDDGSPIPLASYRGLHARPGISRVEILRLRRNMGHQRAIALGVAYAHDNLLCDALLVMDADGEDLPGEAVRLVARCRKLVGQRIVFAERTRRSESQLFQLFYHAYRGVHWALTGISVKVGNFSIVPAVYLPALVTMPALWNHFAAAIFQARLPREALPTTRGVRYKGHSKMNFVALVTHGLQAISVFSDVVAVRLLLGVCLMVCACGFLLAATLGMMFHGLVDTSPWLPFASGGLFVITLAMALGCFSLTLSFLAQRNSLDFIPLRDYRFFVEGIHLPIPAP